MRFPFTFMGLMSVGLGAWTIIYFTFWQPDGPVSGGIEYATAVLMIAFGSWILWRRFTHRDRP